MRSHDCGRFSGDALLFVAEKGSSVTVAEKQHGHAPAQRWQPYVSGEISEIRLPCDHLDVTTPEMLAQIWQGISAWLGLED
jgi:thioesterase domain-containing protein